MADATVVVATHNFHQGNPTFFNTKTEQKTALRAQSLSNLLCNTPLSFTYLVVSLIIIITIVTILLLLLLLLVFQILVQFGQCPMGMTRVYSGCALLCPPYFLASVDVVEALIIRPDAELHHRKKVKEQ
jgi:hypothetical protein